MNWLKERQSLLKEIDSLEAERGDVQGYRSNRPERDQNTGKDNVNPELSSSFLLMVQQTEAPLQEWLPEILLEANLRRHCSN
jgi:hypothetical protein